MTDEPTISFDAAEGGAVVTVRQSELTSRLTDLMLAEFARLKDAGRPVTLVVDLSNVKFIDSVALGALVVLLRRVKKTDGALGLVGLSGHVQRMFQVTSLDRVFDLYDSVASALAAAKPAS